MQRAIWILIALTLGFALNIVVAWRSAHVITGGGPWNDLPQPEAARLWQELAPDIPVDETLNSFSEETPSHRLIFLDQGAPTLRTAAIATADGYEMFAVLSTGWPFQSLTGWRRESYTTAGFRYTMSGMWQLPDKIMGISSPGLDLSPHVLLPIRPMLRGTILNTLFYTGWVALGIFGTHQVRRRARLDRKYCANCEYDLRGTMNEKTIKCPECGTSFDSALFHRPRQFLRWWLLPFLVPPMTLAFLLFVGMPTPPVMLTLWSRVPDPRLMFSSISHAVIGIGLLSAVGFLYLLTRTLFTGYPTWQRILGTVTITAILFSTNYACLVLLIEWAQRATAL